MRRAVLAALATGTVITSALGIGSATPVATTQPLHQEQYASAPARIEAARDAVRSAQRARIEARYLVERAQCAALGGSKRDQCQINAHAARGRALLEAAAPYEKRS